ncbi:MAG: hypothetical protein AAGE94_20975 [Acidobacteriota bacterium]
MKHHLASMLFALTVVLFAGVVFATPEPADTTTAAADTESAIAQTVAPRTTVPTCSDEASASLVRTSLDIVIDEVEPKGYCNCNVDADCKAKCGDRGGSCLITIPCEDPERYAGWCYCGYGTVN